MNPKKIFVATPVYSDQAMNLQTSLALFNQLNKVSALWQPFYGSLLTFNCNRAWAAALNLREQQSIKYFAMVHSDIVPVTPDWLIKLVELKEKNGLNFLSVLSPIKNKEGLTSTAYRQYIKNGDRIIGNTLERLTVEQCQDLPKVFTKRDVRKKFKLKGDFDFVTNTGLFICDFDRNWVTQACFRCEDNIKEINKEFVAQVEPEDWFFTKLIQDRFKQKIGVTTEISIFHIGSHGYSNNLEIKK